MEAILGNSLQGFGLRMGAVALFAVAALLLAMLGVYGVLAIMVARRRREIGLRVVVIALTTLLVFAPSDPTRLADSLAQQWHVPDRFAYGTLAALRVAPLMAADWTTIGAARRLRGLEPRGPIGRISESGGRLLVMLVAAIRRAERLALAMDARGFDSGRRRTHYRPLRTTWRDWLTVAAAVAVAVAALALPR